MKRLRWTSPAEQDLIAIDEYWCGYSTERADEVLDIIRQAGDFLAELPKTGPAMETRDFRKWRVRGTNYVLVYRASGEAVEILRVHHASEDWRRPG